MSAERIAELKANITALDTALRDLALGKRIVKMSYEGNSVEYGPADIALIQNLKRADMGELTRLTGGRSGPRRLVY